MNTKNFALASILAVTALFTACECCRGPGSAKLKVMPTPNNTNSPIVVRPARGTLGKIVRLDPALDALLAKDAHVEKLAVGFHWAEGPVWMPGGCLLFSDVPMNTIFKWQETQGISIFIQPSGYTGTLPRGGERTGALARFSPYRTGLPLAERTSQGVRNR